MAVTKGYIIANILNLPVSSCVRDTADKNVVICKTTGERYLVLSETYDLRRFTYKKLKEEVWRVPLDFILKYTENRHIGYAGIHNRKLIAVLRAIQGELRENFNELVLSIVANKTVFYDAVIKEYGYVFVWQPIDGKEIIKGGFRIYRKK